MSLIADISNYADMIFVPVDDFFRLIFFWSPSVLRTFSASMLTLTIGAILSLSGKKSHMILKYLIYGFFALYALWMLDILRNMESASLMDYNAIMFSIAAPICMFVVGKQAAATKYKGHKIFIYWTLWGVYLLVALLYVFLFPGLDYIVYENMSLRLVIMWFVFMYVIISVLPIYFISKIYGGN